MKKQLKNKIAYKHSLTSTANNQTKDKYAIIGAGPSGLGTARCFLMNHIPFDGYEGASDVGGLWNINNPHSTVYESAHLISSKKMTAFEHFPMGQEVADYPSHNEICSYFKEYARHFHLYDHFRFQTKVEKLEPLEDGWQVSLHNGEKFIYKGVVIANGTLSKPNIPTFSGKFDGEVLHSSSYKSAEIFEGKRVLIVGAGNSGCDIAVDAVHRAKKVDLSVRRGYHFVPKYIFGKPTDAIGGRFTLPRPIKQKVDSLILTCFTGNPQAFGFPEPDHKLYESHPIVNSLILHHLGHGDISIKPNIKKLDGDKVMFEDQSFEAYDLILYATGYKLDYPFIDPAYLNWSGQKAPQLFLNIFPSQHHNLFVIGMLEATGLGWQGRYEQAELVARFIHHNELKTKEAAAFIQKKQGKMPDTRGGYDYLPLERMSYYVHKDTYKKQIKEHLHLLGEESIKEKVQQNNISLRLLTEHLESVRWKKAHRVLITGANGYLGKQLVEELASGKYNPESTNMGIVALDVKPVADEDKVNEVVYVQEDIRSGKLEDMLKRHQIDTVVHLAAIVAPDPKSDPGLEYEIDVEGTANVLEACIRSKVKRIVITSSGAAYGYYKDHPKWITEEVPLRGNDSFSYAKHKRIVEELLAAYRMKHPELEQVIFRVGTILGENTHNKITAFFDRALIPRVLGAKSPFVFVWDKDVIQCLIRAIDTNQTGIFNVAGDGSVSVKEISRMMHKRCLALPAWLFRGIFYVTKRLNKTRYGAELVHFLQYRPVLSNRKLKEVYNYVPTLSSREALQLYVQAKADKNS